MLDNTFAGRKGKSTRFLHHANVYDRHDLFHRDPGHRHPEERPHHHVHHEIRSGCEIISIVLQFHF